MDSRLFKPVRAFIADVIERRLGIDNFDWDSSSVERNFPVPLVHGVGDITAGSSAVPVLEDQEMNFPVPLPDDVKKIVRLCVVVLVYQARKLTTVFPDSLTYFREGTNVLNLDELLNKVRRIFALGVEQSSLCSNWMSIIELIYWTCCMASWLRYDEFHDEAIMTLVDLFAETLCKQDWFQADLLEELKTNAREITDRVYSEPSLEDQALFARVARFEQILKKKFFSA